MVEKKASSLKAKKPEAVIAARPKFMISGASGIGKTLFAMGFPNPYFIDTEGGGTREQYQNKLKQNGGVYFGKEEGSQDFQAIINEIKLLITEKHSYKTLVIDSFSYLYMLEAARAEQEMGSDFGKDKKEANKPTRQLIRWIEKLDMTIILICHSKEKWVRRGKEVYSEGKTFDGYDKLEYLLDLWIEIPDRKHFLVKKSRVDSLPQGQEFELQYDKFADIYGKAVIEKSTEPLIMASAEQVANLNALLEVVKIEPEKLDKLMAKADADTYDDLTADQITKLIVYVQDKLPKGAKK